MASRRALLLGVIVIVLVAVGIAYYAFVIRGRLESSLNTSSSSGGSGPIRVEVGLQPGEELVKLHVVAKSFSGHVIEFIEFDVPIKS